MGVEIERRFLVRSPSVVIGASREVIIQGYFFAQNGYAARVRRLHHVSTDGTTQEGRATVTVKGPRIGSIRAEYEIEVDHRFAEGMLREIEHKVTKSRYQIIEQGEAWDIDVFHGENEGLIIAECEMEQARTLLIPYWCGAEVTDRHEYDNENLAMRPYRTWGRNN